MATDMAAWLRTPEGRYEFWRNGETVAKFVDSDRMADMYAVLEAESRALRAKVEGQEREINDWRQRMRDFANDSEQHRVSHAAWKSCRGDCITLYAKGGYFTAYYADATEVWSQADDTLPMLHIGAKCDPPHRTVIHKLHIAAWLERFAEICMPVEIAPAQLIEPNGEDEG